MEALARYPEAYADFSRRVRWYWTIGAGQVLATIALVPLLALVSELWAPVEGRVLNVSVNRKWLR